MAQAADLMKVLMVMTLHLQQLLPLEAEAVDIILLSHLKVVVLVEEVLLITILSLAEGVVTHLQLLQVKEMTVEME